MTPKVVPASDSVAATEPAATGGVVTAASRQLERIELLRITLLHQAARASTRGMPVSAYHMSARLSGCDVSESDIERELQYLLDKGLLASVPNELSPASSRFRIHARGRDLLDEHGFTE